MKITPIDIAHKNFNKKMFGLDEDEVNDFLQQIANQMEALTHERNSLREMVREREVQVNDFKERDHVLKSTNPNRPSRASPLLLPDCGGPVAGQLTFVTS